MVRFIKIILSLFIVLNSNKFLFSAEVNLTESEKFVKGLSKKYPQTMTYLKMHEVSSTLANKLNKLFTSEIQKLLNNYLSNYDSKAQSILYSMGFDFLTHKPNIFTHQDFPQYVFKIGPDSLQNAARVWYANWISMIQNDFKIPQKRIFFMKSEFPKLSIIVVAEKVNFVLFSEILNLEKQKKLRKMQKITGYYDAHGGNVSPKYIVDTEIIREPKITKLFLNDPFKIYEDPINLRSKL